MASAKPMGQIPVMPGYFAEFPGVTSGKEAVPSHVPTSSFYQTVQKMQVTPAPRSNCPLPQSKDTKPIT